MRILTLASVIAVATVTVNATPGVALFDGSGAVDRPGDQRLLGIHYLTLKDGVKPEDFERFIIGEWNPINEPTLSRHPFDGCEGRKERERRRVSPCLRHTVHERAGRVPA